LQIDHDGTSVILGPNGAGKSLLVRLLHGLIPPESGSINWNGERLGLSIRRSQAIVFQKPVAITSIRSREYSICAETCFDGAMQSPASKFLRKSISMNSVSNLRACSPAESSNVSHWRGLWRLFHRFYSWTSRLPASILLQLYRIENLLNRVSQAGVKLYSGYARYRSSTPSGQRCYFYASRSHT